MPAELVFDEADVVSPGAFARRTHSPGARQCMPVGSTPMAATVEDSKISTGEVVAQTLNAVEHGQEEVITDDWARGAKDSLPNDLTSMYADL